MTAPHPQERSSSQGEILRVVDQALELPPAERDAFVQRASQGNAAFSRAAHELLHACELAERDRAFLSEGACEFAEPIVREEEHRVQQAVEAAFPAVVAALRGRYEFVREVGRGGSAVVHLARDLRHHRDVAVKVMRTGAVDAIQRSRFLHEISIAAQLRHPYVVPLLDSGEADGTLFSVMAYIEGESLRQRLDREGPLAFDDAITITREVAEALDCAHARGIVHRDIKPQNILLGGGHALVADFGIALAVETTLGDRLTEQGLVVGTPVYMSPEQASASAHVDARSDVYSLGCVVYEMLTGEAPYIGVTPRAVIAKHLSAPVPDLAILRPQATTGMRQAVATALAKRPADRFATAGAFSAALTRAVGAPSEERSAVPARRRWQKTSSRANRLAVASALACSHMRKATGTASWIRFSRHTVPSRWVLADGSTRAAPLRVADLARGHSSSHRRVRSGPLPPRHSAAPPTMPQRRRYARSPTHAPPSRSRSRTTGT